jgi:hypothetical protein
MIVAFETYQKGRAMKLQFFTIIGIVMILSGCNTLMSDASDPAGLGNYDRQSMCNNLTRQIEFMQDQGYNTTNQGASQVQMQQLMARYKANGCDK